MAARIGPMLYNKHGKNTNGPRSSTTPKTTSSSSSPSSSSSLEQDWFMVMWHGRYPMLNAPEDRKKRLAELKSMAKCVQMNQDRKCLFMHIVKHVDDESNKNNQQNAAAQQNDKQNASSSPSSYWFELKFFTFKERTLHYTIDCRKIDLFRNSRKDLNFFYFTVAINNNNPRNKHFLYESHIFHAMSATSVKYIAQLLSKQIDFNLLQQSKTETKVLNAFRLTIDRIRNNKNNTADQDSSSATAKSNAKQNLPKENQISNDLQSFPLINFDTNNPFDWNNNNNSTGSINTIGINQVDPWESD